MMEAYRWKNLGIPLLKLAVALNVVMYSVMEEEEDRYNKLFKLSSVYGG